MRWLEWRTSHAKDAPSVAADASAFLAPPAPLPGGCSLRVWAVFLYKKSAGYRASFYF